jgi:hypothetical protein
MVPDAVCATYKRTLAARYSVTDWDRVARLRAKGLDWKEIAEDRKVGFHPPPGSSPGRALRVRYERKRPAAGREKLEARGDTHAHRFRIRAHLGWVVGGTLTGLIAVGIGALLLVTPSLNSYGPSPTTYAGPGATGTQVEFSYLSQQHSDACHWPGVNLGDETANVNFIQGLADGVYLQGACCTPMNYTEYSIQTANLQNYSSVPVIPADPYNVLGRVAKADVAGENLVLSTSQQATLASASSLTAEGGWCCCECWAYYAHEGLAKALIVNHGYTAQQVAAVTNLEDCCGGPGQMSM